MRAGGQDREWLDATERRCLIRVAVLADIHGNLPALDALLRDVEAARTGVIVLDGDIADGPMPAQTLERLDELGERLSGWAATPTGAWRRSTARSSRRGCRLIFAPTNSPGALRGSGKRTGTGWLPSHCR